MVELNGDDRPELLVIDREDQGFAIFTTHTGELVELELRRWTPFEIRVLNTADSDGDGIDEIYTAWRDTGAMLRWESEIEDCNWNETPDDCDLLAGFDTDSDGVIDSCQGSFTRGNCNSDATIDIGDAISLLDLLFGSASFGPCEDACDANDDGATDVADAVTVLDLLFAGLGTTLPPPTTCGVDPTADGLDCAISTCP